MTNATCLSCGLPFRLPTYMLVTGRFGDHFMDGYCTPCVDMLWEQPRVDAQG